jgi:ribonucleoside-diphosphate reductase alpha chain
VRFEPSGLTRNRDIPMAKSLVDYIFRWMAMEFTPGYKARHAPQRPEPVEPEPTPASNGNGNGHKAEPDAKPFKYVDDKEPVTHAAADPVTSPANSPAAPMAAVAAPRVNRLDALSQQGADMQSDAPACDTCGSITVRSGTCYKCLNCGASMGCS